MTSLCRDHLSRHGDSSVPCSRMLPFSRFPKHMNIPSSSVQKSVNGPCEAFLSIGSMFSSFVINRLGGEGQYKERLSRHRQMSTYHFSPGLQHSCPFLGVSVAAALVTETRGLGKFMQMQIVPTVTEIIKCLPVTALSTLSLLT